MEDKLSQPFSSTPLCLSSALWEIWHGRSLVSKSSFADVAEQGHGEAHTQNLQPEREREQNEHRKSAQKETNPESQWDLHCVRQIIQINSTTVGLIISYIHHSAVKFSIRIGQKVSIHFWW